MVNQNSYSVVLIQKNVHYSTGTAELSMSIEKVKIRDDLYLVAAMNKKNRVIAAGTFEHQWEAEMAADLLHEVFLKKNKPSKVKLDDVIRVVSTLSSAQ